MNKKLLITGGAGFIGSAVIRHIIEVQGGAYLGEYDIIRLIDIHGKI